MASPANSSSGSIKITCWNVRNLSDEIFRPGKKGNGVSTDDRVQVIAENIARLNSHILFLLEVGNDAGQIGEIITKRLNKIDKQTYSFLESDLTGQEKYLAIFKKDNPPKDMGMYGTLKDMRQGWLVAFQGKTILVLHAPFSFEAEAVILDVFDDCYKKNDIPNIFCGDFNIKAKRIPDFGKGMNGLGYVYAGPNSETSLRTHTTILVNSDNLMSEQYDQFWTTDKNSHTVVEVVYPNKKIEDALVKSLTGKLQNAIDITIGDFKEARSNAIKTAPITLSDFANELNKLDEQVKFLKNMSEPISLMNEMSPKEWIILGKDVYARLEKLGREAVGPSGYSQIISKIRKVNQAFSYVCGGIEMLAKEKDIRDTLLTSYAISDHLPISLEIPLK